MVRGPLSRYRQYNSIPGISTSYYSFFKIKTFFLDTKFSFLQGSVPSTPLQSQPCWSTFPELSFNIYKVTGINVIKFWIAKCNTSINIIYTVRILQDTFMVMEHPWLLRVKTICSCPSWNIFRIDFLYIRGESSLIKFIYVWPAFRLQYRSENVIFSGTLNFTITITITITLNFTEIGSQIKWEIF